MARAADDTPVSGPYAEVMDQAQRIVWREVALTAAVAVVQIGGTAAAAGNQAEYGDLPVGGALLLAVAVAAVPLRLRFPATAAWVAKAATAVYWSLDFPRGPVFFALIITFGNLLFFGRRGHAIAVALAGFIAIPWGGALLGNHDAPSAGSLVLLATWLVALFSAAEALRAQRDRRREQARSQAEVVQRQVADERLRIARELHDVVAHNMSLINVQAGVALHLADDATPAVRDALQVIKGASKDALVELRAILGVLRHVDDSEAADGESAETARVGPRHPTPDLGQLDELVASARASGVEVTARVDVNGVVLPQPVQLAAYRIVQESLTNVARHADPPRATVTVRADGDTLVIDVEDEGHAPATRETVPSGGNGLIGMRERAAAVGGQLTAGPRMRGGFAVNARLPLGDR